MPSIAWLESLEAPANSAEETQWEQYATFAMAMRVDIEEVAHMPPWLTECFVKAYNELHKSK